MPQPIMLRHQGLGRPATLKEHREDGGYEALAQALRHWSPEEVTAAVRDSGLRGRGGGGFPAGVKWASVPSEAKPRYILANTDEMEPGAFKDRVLMQSDPHLVIEGALLAGYAISAHKAFFFVRPSYEEVAQALERELEAARQAGLLGENILGSRFSFDIAVHRSGGRYICGESSAQVNAMQGNRPNPKKGGPHLTEQGLWGLPTLVNNVETLALVPHVVRQGAEWFKSQAASPRGDGLKLYSISGKVRRPGCYELPMGTRLGDIIEEAGGGMLPGTEFKACLTGGGSTGFMTKEHFDTPMDFDSLKEIGHRLGTGAVVVFDQDTCLVGATLNLLSFFARESCGWCTPCREGLPYMRELLWRIENGDGRESFLETLKEMAGQLRHAYCGFAPGAALPLLSLLADFEDEITEHLIQKGCPFAGAEDRKQKTEDRRQ
jgi:NADH-quinone oxidoreductase subunit F